MMPAPMPRGQFLYEGRIEPAFWQAQSPLLVRSRPMNGAMRFAGAVLLAFGMQMSGIGGPGQFMGIQSSTAFTAPFTFSATVTGHGAGRDAL